MPVLISAEFKWWWCLLSDSNHTTLAWQYPWLTSCAAQFSNGNVQVWVCMFGCLWWRLLLSFVNLVFRVLVCM
jgi:hypothetical protein